MIDLLFDITADQIRPWLTELRFRNLMNAATVPDADRVASWMSKG